MTETDKPEEQQISTSDHNEGVPEKTPDKVDEADGPSAPDGSATAEANQEEQTDEEPKKFVPDAILAERLERLRRKQDRMGPVPTVRRDPTFLPSVDPNNLDADLDREIEEAMGGLTDAQLYGEMTDEQSRPPGEAPQRKTGKVISVHAADVFVEIPGSRSQGMLPVTQFPDGKPEIGTEVEIEIERYDSANGLLILTRKGAATSVDWSSVAEGMVVEARVLETNKGGLSVEINGIRGFMPISQIELFRVEKPEEYVNQKLLCEVTEVKPESRNLVVSRRVVLEREREEQREKLWQELEEDQIRDGVVRKVQNFGAFVDLGGVDGLLHVSEMSWTRVNDPGDVVQPGQKVKVAVLKVDREQRRIGLSLKQLLSSPWDNVEENYIPGRIVSGKVTRLAQFGAFVELEPGIEGLIHISELADQRVHHPRDVLQSGQEVNVQVLNIDLGSERISLSLKAAQDDAEEEPDEPEEQAPPKKERPRTTPLRGGIGDGTFDFGVGMGGE